MLISLSQMIMGELLDEQVGHVADESLLAFKVQVETDKAIDELHVDMIENFMLNEIHGLGENTIHEVGFHQASAKVA